MTTLNAVPARVAAEYDWAGKCKTILGYMDGTHTYYQTRWLDLDVVYLPHNIGGNHWIMLHIDLQEGVRSWRGIR